MADSNDASTSETGRLFETMLLMRRFEEVVQGWAEQKRFDGHYHLYIGQEAIGAGAMAALRADDRITTTHRNHGHMLARGAEPARAFAEILGRTLGLNHGYGGTFHLCAPDLGFLSTSGIVGGAISLAVGGGLACRQEGRGALCATFFGDGALQEGVAFEALNLAAIWHLPVLFLCENNDADAWEPSEGMRARSELAATSLLALPRSLGISTMRVPGTEPGPVRAAVTRAAAQCRAGAGPVFLELATRRWPGNFTQYPTLATGRTDLGMASAADLPEKHRDWFTTDDPVLRAARALLADGTLDAAGLAAIDAATDARIAEAAEAALASPMPPPEAALAHVFADVIP